MEATLAMQPGMAPGYRAAMHGLCVTCHRDHEQSEGVAEPFLSRCAGCHRGHSPEGEEIRVWEGWNLATNRTRP